MKRDFMSRHHLTPKCRRKGFEKDFLDPNAILMLWRDRHDCWHKLFKNNTLEEVILLLKRVLEIKEKKYGRKP